MQNNGWSLFRLGIRRRRHEVLRMRAMLGLSVVFLTFTLLFQDNMNAYTMQSNYQSYGRWLFQSQDPIFDDNPYLRLSGVVRSGSRIYTIEPRNGSVTTISEEEEAEEAPLVENSGQLVISAADESRTTNLFLGSLPTEFAEENSILLYKGRFPEADNEIVMELSSLQAMGLGYELGQEISFFVSEPVEWPERLPGQPRPDPPPRVLDPVSFTLVGTVERYSARWSSYGDLPNALITERAFSMLDMEQRSYNFYSLREEYVTPDVWQFAVELYDSIGAAERYRQAEYLFNSAAYFNPFWGDPTIYRIVTAVLVLLSTAIVSYLTAAYLGRRRVFFLQLREMGAAAREVWRMAAFECVWSCLPAMLLALLASYALSLLAVGLISGLRGLPFFYAFRFGTLLRILACAALVLLLSLVIGFALLSGSRITVRRKGFSKRAARRLLRRSLRLARRNNPYLNARESTVRIRRLHNGRTLLLRLSGILCCAVLLFSAAQIIDRVETYRSLQAEHGDLEGYMPYISTFRYQVPVKPYMTPFRRLRDFEIQQINAVVPSLRSTIPEDFFLRAAELPGVERVEHSLDDAQRRIEWPGKEDDPFYQSSLNAYARIFTATQHVLDLDAKKADAYLRALDPSLTLVSCYDDAEAVWKEHREALDPSYADFEAFRDGTQVIVAVDQSWVILSASRFNGEMVIPENEWDLLGASFRPGDQLEILCGNDSVTVTVAAVIDAGSQPRDLIQLIGSEGLMRAMAKADGVDAGWNRFRIDLNALSERENTMNSLSGLCSEFGVQYTDYVEPLREARNALFQAVVSYGFFGVVLLVLWLFVCSAIAAEQAERLSPERKALRRMGCGPEQLRSAKRADALRQSLALLPSLLLFLAARVVETHQTLILSHIPGYFSDLCHRYLFYTGTLPLETSLESDPWLFAFFYTLERTAPWLALIPLAIILLLHWYLTARNDKGDERHA